jgi:hypothetical protein
MTDLDEEGDVDVVDELLEVHQDEAGSQPFSGLQIVPQEGFENVFIGFLRYPPEF